MVRWLLVRFRPDLNLRDAVLPLTGDGPSAAELLAVLRQRLAALGVTGDPIADEQVGITDQYPARLEEVRGEVRPVETQWHKQRATFWH